MSTDLHTLAIRQLRRVLTNLQMILRLAAKDLEARGIDESVLLASRLYPDMCDLQQQVQAATDIARRGAARLIGEEPSSLPDNAPSFEGLIARIDTTLSQLEAFPAEAFIGKEQTTVTMPIPKSFGGGKLTFNALEFLTDFLLPNVYFHTTTAYAILRHNGVNIGKRDFLGMELSSSGDRDAS